jgi:hypothetical protein
MQTTPHIQQFNERIKQLNHSQARMLAMTASDARSLHAEIFALLAVVNQQRQNTPTASQSDQISGGSW